MKFVDPSGDSAAAVGVLVSGVTREGVARTINIVSRTKTLAIDLPRTPGVFEKAGMVIGNVGGGALVGSAATAASINPVLGAATGVVVGEGLGRVGAAGGRYLDESIVSAAQAVDAAIDNAVRKTGEGINEVTTKLNQLAQSVGNETAKVLILNAAVTKHHNLRMEIRANGAQGVGWERITESHRFQSLAKEAFIGRGGTGQEFDQAFKEVSQAWWKVETQR